MLDDSTIAGKAREKLTLGPLVPSDDELAARYLGYYESPAALARALYAMDAPHIDLAAWPHAHIDWALAAAALFAGDGGRHLLQVDGHWFDALAAPPVLAS